MGAMCARAWTLSEVRYLMEHYADETRVEIGAALGRNANSVGSMAARCGLSKPRKYGDGAMDAEIERRIREEGFTRSAAQMAEGLGVSAYRVAEMRRAMLGPRETKRWSAEDIAQMQDMRARGVPMKEVGKALGRSAGACYQKCWEIKNGSSKKH